MLLRRGSGVNVIQSTSRVFLIDAGSKSIIVSYTRVYIIKKKIMDSAINGHLSDATINFV